MHEFFKSKWLCRQFADTEPLKSTLEALSEKFLWTVSSYLFSMKLTFFKETFHMNELYFLNRNFESYQFFADEFSYK